jgi:arginine deiminase
MGFSVQSEVGKLRKVLVHRPGLEHSRLTPSNAEEFLFDDVLWVKQAKNEHDAFCEVMRERGVEVFEVESLLSEVLAFEDGRDWVLRHALNERMVGPVGTGRAREWMAHAKPADVANLLIGGITANDVEGGPEYFGAFGPADMLVPPLPNLIFQRDPSSWIYGGVTLNPMAKPARRPETTYLEAIYRFHPMFTGGSGVRIWFGGVDQDWGRAGVEGGDIEKIGNGAVMIGMGERTTPQAVHLIARALFEAWAARLVVAVHLPKSRSYMHLDTVLTMVDHAPSWFFPRSWIRRARGTSAPGRRRRTSSLSRIPTALSAP